MAQKTTWGQIHAVQGGIYHGVSPMLAEGSATGDATNPGYGVRMGGRIYWQNFSQMFASSSSSDTTAFKAGHDLYVSISNPNFSGFSYANGIAGAYDSQLALLWGRVAALPFSSAVTSGSPYGGLTRAKIRFCWQHEVDNPGHQSWGTAAQYLNWCRHLAATMNTAGVRNNIDFSVCVMSYGIPLGRCDQYMDPTLFDSIGLDFYSDFTKTWTYDGSLTPFATGFAPSLAFVRKYNQRFCCPEFSIAESGNDSAMQAWFDGVRDTLNNATDVTCDGIFLWSQASSAYQNSMKLVAQDPATGTAHLGKHNGIQDAINGMGGNAIITSAGAGVPSAPTGIVVTPSTDGTAATITWGAPNAGDNVTAARAYIGQGVTTALHKDDPADLPVTPRSYTFHNLTPGGTTYTASVTWVNAQGNSGFGTVSGALVTFQTATPPQQINAPTITSATAAQDATTSTSADLASTATDPQGQALSYVWKITDPGGNVTTWAGQNPTATGLTASGTYAYDVAVTNTSGLTTHSTGTFTMSPAPVSAVTTRYLNWLKPQTGQRPRILGPLLRGFMDDLDQRMYNLLVGKNNHNAALGYVASAYDPASLSGSTTQTASAGFLYWFYMQMQDFVINAIRIGIDTAQTTGATGGSQLALFDSTNALMEGGVYVTGVDAALAAPVNNEAVFTLPAQIVSQQPGDMVGVALWTPTAVTTPAKMRCTSGGSFSAKFGPVAAGLPRYGSANIGAGGIGTSIPVASYSGPNCFFMALS